MYVHSVKLNNFKSIGSYPEAEIILEPRVTTIVGKNESGKSNILDGLSRVYFRSRNNSAFAQDVVNRNASSNAENTYIITLKPTADDIDLGITDDTIVEIAKSNYAATGGILAYFERVIRPDVSVLIDVLGNSATNPFKLRDTDLASYRTYYKEITTTDKIDIPRRNAAFDFIYGKINNIDPEKQEGLSDAINSVREKWTVLMEMLPRFFFRNANRRLLSTYKFDDIAKELKSSASASTSLLREFVKVIDVSIDDFLSACSTGTSPMQETMRRKINQQIIKKINTAFKEFYQTEEVFLDLSFNNGTISFGLQSNSGSPLLLSERSNGLRWYLETFIDAQANDISNRNIVYLFDEPGTSLHVNAQKELIKLFGHLAEKGNQVVYTTHSPYMLDIENEGVHRIRAVIKDTEGFTYIYKTAYDCRIAPQSQKDTLAPIISAIGMSMNDTFGPAKDKINIVPEGMSDYIYLCTMAKLLRIDSSKYTIIPSVGASNCVNICSILHGWGCHYIAVFDYDNAGVQSGGEYMRKEMMLEYNHQYCYLNDVSQDDVDKKTYKETPYMIEDMVIRDEIERYCVETSTSRSIGKPLMAKLMCNAIENGSFQLNERSVSNFKLLFERIFSYCSNN